MEILINLTKSLPTHKCFDNPNVAQYQKPKHMILKTLCLTLAMQLVQALDVSIVFGDNAVFADADDMPASITQPTILFAEHETTLPTANYIYTLKPFDSTMTNCTQLKSTLSPEPVAMNDMHLHATGLWLKASADTVLNATTCNVSCATSTSGSCDVGAVLLTDEPLSQESLYVGDITQMYRADLHVQVARFHNELPPYIGGGLGVMLGMIFSSYKAKRNGLPQCAHSIKFGTATGLIGESLQRSLTLLMHKQSDEILIVVTAVSFAAAAFVYASHSSCVHYLPGESRLKFAAKSLSTAIATFVVSGSPYALLNCAQCGIKNSNSGRAAQTYSVTANVRRP